MKNRIKNQMAGIKFFKKWSNKGYGIFSSLKVLIKICVMSVGYLLLLNPVNTFAQTDSIRLDNEYDLDEVVVLEKQRATSFSELTSVVLVISNQQIKSLPASTLQELLEHFASIDIRQRGGHGVQADLMVRGGSFDQVLVLINGINITDPQTGHHNLNIPIDLESIQRIEILQGPGSRAYGLGAFSGAINIITSPQGKNYADIGISLGEHALFKLNTSAAYSTKNHELFVSASSSKSEGYMVNTDFLINNVFAQSILNLKKYGKFSTQIGIQDKGFGAQSFYTPRYPEQFEKTTTYLVSTTYKNTWGKLTFSPSFYIRMHDDRFELFRYEAPEWYVGHNYHSTSVSGGKLDVSNYTQWGKLQAGIEFRSEKILSNVLGEPLEELVAIPGHDTLNFSKGKVRNIASVFADYTAYLDPITISSGVLLTRSNQFGISFNYGADASINILKAMRAYVSYNRSTRYPTFTDLYYNGPTNIGNPNLKPELADNYEVGLKTTVRNLSFSSAFFMRNGKNIIDWVKQSSDDKWTTQNYTMLKTKGVETHLSTRFNDGDPIIQQISLSYTYMILEKQNSELLSYYVLDYLKHKIGLAISHKLYKKLNISWSAVWQDREGYYTNFSSGVEQTYKPFIILSASIKWEFDNIRIFTDISNLADTQFHDLGNIPQPGRWLSFGIRYRLE